MSTLLSALLLTITVLAATVTISYLSERAHAEGCVSDHAVC